ncbi:RNA recognition motif 2-domain-containing protein, partial [Hysterangium stoloniferum]
GDLKGIFVRFQPDHGAIVLAFFDLRHTIRAHRQISTHTFFDGVQLTSRFISPKNLRSLIGQSNFVSQNDGELHISTSFAGPEVELDALALQNVLASFGDLRVFNVETQARAFHAEYFDARDALSAIHALNNRVILGVRLHLTSRDTAVPTLAGERSSPSLDNDNQSQADLGDRPTLQHSLSEKNLRDRPRSLSTSSPAPQLYHVHARRISNIYHFDSVGRTMLELPPTAPPRPRSISVSSDTDSPIAGRLDLPPPSPCGGAGRMTFSPQSPLESRCLPSPYSAPMTMPPEEIQWTHNEQVYATEQYLASPQQTEPSPLLQMHMSRRTLGPRHPRNHGGLGLEMVNEREKDMQPERNKIDIGKIERGEETRTTVMIKNIPNKMSDRNLIDFINDICPRKIDFLYLRMDFTNGCNVGYAFVNFINVEDLLHFAKTKLGTKWNLFSSEKVLGMSYANCRGKEALIDKFRSSSIMDQREAWRPKLFYSHGPKQGLPEDFPAPTHIRRKERSTLLPSELHQSRALFHHQPHMRN